MPGTFRRRVWVKDLNPNLICVLCGGYFIDATTLTECLHSFCKTCIIRYLETSKNCPVCEVVVHKTRPHLNLRSDKTLQDLVYKMIPGLYKAEMKRRRDYYAEHPEGAPLKMGEARGDENAERILYSKDDKFSVALHFCSRGIKDEWSVRTLSLPEVTASSQEPEKSVRYLQCPAGVTVLILKRFVRHKYDLSARYHVDIFHSDEALCDEYTLIDVAYIYTWRRKEPLNLCFSVYELLTKRRKIERADNTRLLDLKRWTKEESKAGDSKGDLGKAQPDPKRDLKAADVSCDLKQGQVKQETDQDAGQQSHVQTCLAMCPDEQKADQKGCKRKFGEMENMDVKVKGEVSSGTAALVRTVTATSTFVPPVSQPESKAAAPSQLVEEQQAEKKSTLQVKKGDITPHTVAEKQKITGVTGSTKESNQPCQAQPQKLAPAQPAPSSVPLTSPTTPASASQSEKKAVKRSCPKSWVVTTVSPSKKKGGVLPGQVSLLPVVSLPVLKAGATLQAVADPAQSCWAETVPRTGSAVKAADSSAPRMLLPQQKDIISGTATQTVAMTSQQVSKLLMSQQASKAQTLQAARTLTSLQTSKGSLQAPKTLAAKPQLAPAKVHMSVQASESPMRGHVMPRVVTSSPGAKVLQASKGLMASLPSLKSRPQLLIEKKANTAGQKQQRLKESKTFAASVVSSSTSAPSISAAAPSTSSSVQCNTANVKPCSVSLPINCSQRTGQLGSVSSTKSPSPALLSAPSLSAPQAPTSKPQMNKSTESSSSASRPAGRPVAADSDALSIPVSLNSSVPSAAAAAAGAASPSPAALAASSSPSPPMASSAASVRVEAEAVSKCLVSASGCPVTPTLSASSGSLTAQPRSSAQQQKGVTASSLQSAGTEKASDHKTVKVARSEPVPPSSGISQSANQTAVSAHSQTSKCEVPSLSQSQSCTATQNTTTTTPVSNSAQSVRAVQRASEVGSIAGTTVTVTETAATTKVEAVISNKPEDQKELSHGNLSTTDTDKSVKSANPATVNEGNVLTARVPPAGIQAKPQTSAKLDTPKTAGFKVLAVSRATTLTNRNGMPTVVTRPTRVINASTSVNTLCHKLPVSSNSAATPGQRPPVSVSISSQKLHGTTTTVSSSSSSSTPSAKVSTCTVTTLTHKLPPASSTTVSAPGSKPTASGTTVPTPSLAKPAAGTSIATPSLAVSAGLTTPSQSKGVTSSTVSAAASSHKAPVACAVVSGTTGSTPAVSGAASVTKLAVTSPSVSSPGIIRATKPTVAATSAVSGVVSAKPESSAAVTAVSCEPAATATTASNPIKPAAAASTASPVSTTPIVTCTSVSTPVSKPVVTCVGASTPTGKPAVTCTPVVSPVKGTAGSSGLKSCSVPLTDIKQLALTRSSSLPHLSSSSSCTSAAVTVTSSVLTSSAPSVQASSASSPQSVTKSVTSPSVGDSKQSSNVSVDAPKPSPNPSGKVPCPSSSRAEVKPCSTVGKMRPQSACAGVTSMVKLAPNVSKAVSLGHGVSKSQTLSTSQATKASSSSLPTTTSSSAHQAANSLTPRSGATSQTPGRSGQGGSHTVSKAVAPLKHHASAKSPGNATSQAVGKPVPISSLAAASCPKGSSLMPVPLQSLVLAGGSVGEVVEGLSPLAMATMAQRANQIQQAFNLQQALQQAKQQQQQHAKQHEQQQQQMRELQQYHFLQQQQQQHILNMRAVAALAAGFPLQTSALLAGNPMQVGAVLGAMCPSALSPLQPPSSTDGVKKQAADSSKKQTSDGSAKKATTQATAAAAVPAGKKGGESSGKKKISDIANTLHRKVSQTAGGETGGGKTSSPSLASAEQRPPVAHSSSTASATSTPSSSSSSRPRTDDEQPLNLVTRSAHEEKSGN